MHGYHCNTQQIYARLNGTDPRSIPRVFFVLFCFVLFCLFVCLFFVLFCFFICLFVCFFHLPRFEVKDIKNRSLTPFLLFGIVESLASPFWWLDVSFVYFWRDQVLYRKFLFSKIRFSVNRSVHGVHLKCHSKGFKTLSNLYIIHDDNCFGVHFLTDCLTAVLCKLCCRPIWQIVQWTENSSGWREVEKTVCTKARR